MATVDFEGAVRHLKTADVEVTNADKLSLYALFKQASEGDCSAPEPSRFSVVKHAKWEAWHALRGQSGDSARRQYLALVSRLDPSFGRAAKPAVAPSPTKTEEEVIVPAQTEVGPLGPPLLACLCVSACGVAGFLGTTLSTQALMFLAIAAAGVAGAVAYLQMALRARGLIVLYPAILQRILLDRTLVEVILDGTIVQRIKDAITEISPVFYCKTPEDRIAALENMSEATRRLFTTRGIVNLLPEWQQRLTLSELEYRRQKSKLADETRAYRPPLDHGLQGPGKAPNPPQPRLDAQRRLAAKLFNNSVRDTLAKLVLKRVNRELCERTAGFLGLVFMAQLASSHRARRALRAFLQASMLRGTAAGAAIFALLALVHQAADKYQAKRAPLLDKNNLKAR